MIKIRKTIDFASCAFGLVSLILSISAYPESSHEYPALTSEQKSFSGSKDGYCKGCVRIDNSSVWISESEYEQFINGRQLPIFVYLSGPISKEDVLVFKELLAPYLNKNYLKKHPKPLWYKDEPDEIGFNVRINSEGGDVYAAMALGRLFRKSRTEVEVRKSDKCLSSCVFLLAGAVERIVLGTVGIHRPFTSDSNPTSFKELQARTTRLGADVSAYFKAMNITESLYDSMKLIPPEEIKILTDSELEEFGLSQKDPVFSELGDNAEARLAGISKNEFLVRKRLSEECKREGYSRLSRNSNGVEDDDLELGKYLDKLLAYRKMENECDLKTIYKDVAYKLKKEPDKQ